ncbi:hypothetical protein [Natrinema sp. H-ect4]|uniref:hypothetical protein n=1 Tax=Natrinema sp. H-ect4 TaxID=3242699 RepID=UPI0035A8E753
MTTWIQSSNTKQDGTPVTRKIKIPEMAEEIWFTDQAYAETADDVADILANNIDSITKVAEPTDPGTYYGDAGANTTVEIVVADGAFDNLTVESLDSDVVSTDELPSAHGYRGVTADQSLSEVQSVLDEYDKRDVTLLLKRGDYGTFTSPIGIGQLTRLVGEAALLDDQSGDEYDPRPILRFTGSHGLQTADGVSYRSQRPIVKELTLAGDNTAGKAGIDWRRNANGSSSISKVGLPEVHDTYILDFEIGINGHGYVDSPVVENVHFRNVKNGLMNFDTEARVKRIITWDMNGGLTIDVKKGSVVRDCEFADKNDSQDGVKAAEGDVVITQNSWDFDYNAAVLLGSSSSPVRGCVVSGNTFGGTPHSSVISVFGSDNQIYGNTWAHTTSSSDRAIYVKGDRNRIAEMVPGGNYNGSEAVRIASGSDNIVMGYFGEPVRVDSGATDPRIYGAVPGGIEDNGATRPRYNGVIGGGPLGGADIGSLTGANAGDVAMADGTTGDADAWYVLKSNGDWQAMHDPTVTITPA